MIQRRMKDFHYFWMIIISFHRLYLINEYCHPHEPCWKGIWPSTRACRSSTSATSSSSFLLVVPIQTGRSWGHPSHGPHRWILRGKFPQLIDFHQSHNINSILLPQSAVAELKGHETAAPWLLILFTVVTVLLTSMTAFVILFTACLLPYMTANAELDSVLCSTGLIHRFKSHRTYFLERGFQTLIQITWLLTSTGIVFLFLIDMILITWIKFQRISKEAAYAGTTIISPTILLIIYFGIRFWKELLQRKLFGDQLIQEEDDEDLDSRFLQSISVRGGPPPQPKRKLSDAPGTSGTKMS